MSGFNCVTDTVLLSIKRYGASDFFNDGEFDSGTESYYSDLLGSLTSGVILEHHKIITNTITEMTAGEKTTVDAVVPVRISFNTIFPKGVKEILSANGAINLNAYSTRLTKGSQQDMTLADATVDGLCKVIRTKSDTPATITCALDQSGSAYVSFSMLASGRVNISWLQPENYWDLSDYKEITLNT